MNFSILAGILFRGNGSVRTCTYMYLDYSISWYLGLFGDHIVPVVLHSYTQVLLRADLINSKGKPLESTAQVCVEEVGCLPAWKLCRQTHLRSPCLPNMLPTSTKVFASFKQPTGREQARHVHCGKAWFEPRTLATGAERATNFHNIYIDGKENAKMTGDLMKMLMLTLPFLVCDLISPKVDVLVCTGMYLFVL
jgi:hypothetical protein